MLSLKKKVKEQKKVEVPAIKDKVLRICPLSLGEMVDRISQFIEGFSGIGFYNYQKILSRRIVEAILERDGDVITCLQSRQSGKTQCIADTSTGLSVILPALAKQFPDDDRLSSFKRGVWIGIFAPVLDQALTCYSRMRDHLNMETAQQMLADPEIGVEVIQNRGDTCTFSNGSFIRARSASEDSQIEGGTFHVVILEEAQRLSRAKVNKEISPMLSATNGLMIKIGTAYMSKGGFHSSIQTNIEQLKRTGKRNHFEFPYDIVIREKRAKYNEELKATGVGNSYHLNYEKWVNGEIKRLGGVDSDDFKMNFRLLWQETRQAAVRAELFGRASMNGLYGKKCQEIGEEIPGTSHWRVVVGIDVGKSNDSTVVTVMAVDPDALMENDEFVTQDPNVEVDAFSKVDDRSSLEVHGKYIINWLELGGSFEGEAGQYAAVMDFLKPYILSRRLVVVVIDSTGMGDAVHERFEVLLGDEIMTVPYQFTLVKKHLLYKNYLKELHSGRVFYPGSPRSENDIRLQRFRSQHLDLEKRIVGSYTCVAHSDEEGHDDYPDSAALAAWGEKLMSHAPEMPEIEDFGRGSYQRPVAIPQGRAARYARGR